MAPIPSGCNPRVCCCRANDLSHNQNLVLKWCTRTNELKKPQLILAGPCPYEPSLTRVLSTWTTWSPRHSLRTGYALQQGPALPVPGGGGESFLGKSRKPGANSETFGFSSLEMSSNMGSTWLGENKVVTYILTSDGVAKRSPGTC